MVNILIVEDDAPLSQVLCDFLKNEGFITNSVNTGSAALQEVAANPPDLVLLDLGLPDIQGETVLKQLRESLPDLPIVILTAKSKPQEVAAGLNLGAADYLPKPFDTEELLARINARIKKGAKASQMLKFGPLSLDFDRKIAIREDLTIDLTKTEFELLAYLLKHAGKVLNRELILNAVWGYSPSVESRVVDIYIGYLRKKIDDGFDLKLIKNKRGFGYLIDHPNEPDKT